MHLSRTPGDGILVQNVRKKFAGQVVLRDVNLEVRAGQFACLLGPSGCGKTTLLRCIAGLDTPDQGAIQIGGRKVIDVQHGVEVAPEQRGLGMVFQHYALWPHMTIAENIAYPLKRRGYDAAARLRRVQDIAELVGVRAALEKRPGELSGGQQQRVALARALVSEPPVLLLDEPLSNLDASLRLQLRRELRNLHERLGMTTVLVTHDQEEAAALADVVAVMQGGVVTEFGAPDDVLNRPRTRTAAEFVGFENYLPGKVEDTANGVAIRTAGGALIIADPLNAGSGRFGAGNEVVLAARREALAIIERTAVGGASHNTIDGTIRHVSLMGPKVEFEIDCADTTLVLDEPRAKGQTRLPGDQVLITWPSACAVVPNT